MYVNRFFAKYFCRSALCTDLQSSYLPLLRPCANNVNKDGMNQETFVLNPDCALDRSPGGATQLQMLAFLGKLLGAAARGKQYLDLSLAPPIWKLLVGMQLQLEDVRSIDVVAVNQLQRYRER